MKTTIALAIVAILAVGLTVASLAPIHEASATGKGSQYTNGGFASGQGSSHSDSSAYNQGTARAFGNTPHNQPCSTSCP